MTRAMAAAPHKDRDIPDNTRAAPTTSAVGTHSRIFITRDVPAGIGARLTREGLTVMPFQSTELHAALAEGGRCAILWADPAAPLAAALEQGGDPVDAIGSWLIEAQSILTTFRRNRRRLTLIEAQALTGELAEPERALLRDRLACPDLPLPLGVGAGTNRLQGPDPQAAPSLAAMVAAVVVPRVAEIQDCLSELQSSGISPLQSELPVAALAMMATSFSGWQAQAAGPTEELELLRAEMARLQRDLANKDTSLSEAIAKGQTRDKTVIQAAAEMAAEREARTRELALLRDQIALQQKEFDSTLAKLQTETVARRRAESQRDLVLSSTSWRVTRPIRAIRTMISGGSKPVDMQLAEERALLPKP